MNNFRRSALLLLLALSLLLSACSGLEDIILPLDVFPTSPQTDSGQHATPAKSSALSPEKTSAVAGGVTVEVGDYVLDGEAELSVTKKPTEDHSEEGYKIDVYDIRIGDMHQLDDYITIRIPYDTTYCQKGQDPAKCVGAKYKNEETGQWEDVLFEVDAAKQELVIHTDHLSSYGALHVDNEGRRYALVTEVEYSPLDMTKSQAIDFAKKIADDDPGVKSELSEYVGKASDMFFDYADRLDNAINIATLGDVPEWLDTSIPDTNLTLFSALGYIATATNLMKIAAQEASGDGADKGAVLNLIRDVGSKVTTYWADAFTTVGSGALSVGMGGVLIVDKMLTSFAEEAHSTKMEDISYVYHHYNEGFSATFSHKLMKAKDWRKKAIDAIEKNPDDPEVVISTLEKGFRKYASDFFELTADQMAEVAADTPGVTVKRIPSFTEAEKKQLIDDYVAHLKDTTMPAVLTSVKNYMIRKSEEVQLAAVNEIKNYFNTKISITMTEDLPKNAKSELKGYTVRFAPLSEKASKKSWTGKWPESGLLKTNATLIGFITSGYPHTVEFFKPGDDPDSAKPEFTVPFKISMPSITIKINRAPTFEELVGYYSDGTATITEFYISKELRASIASSKKDDDELGCDLNELILTLEKQKGVPNEAPFSIEAVGKNTGILKMTDDGEDSSEGFGVKYSPAGGTLSVSYEEDGIALGGTLKASYNSKKTGVKVTGNLSSDLGYGSDLKLTLKITGTKPLEK